jgi:ribosome-binding factor A
MPSNRRSERLNQLLREELAALLQSEIKDPRLRAVTVTAVDVPSEELIAGLESAERFVRRRLGRELRLRRIPEFRFHLDRSLEHVLRIESLLEEALGDQKADEAPGDEEE